MNEDREDAEIKDHDRKKRQFIREQLKPQWRKTVIILMRRLLLVLCAAVLFGGISAVSFYVMRIYFPWQDHGEKVVTLPVSTVDNQRVQERKVSDEIDEDTLASLENYEEFFKDLAEVGENANAAVVRLRKSDVSFSGILTDHDASKGYCGILFHESAQLYYILTEYAVAQEKDPMVTEIACGESGLIAEIKVVGSCEKLNLAVVSVDKSGFTKEMQEKIVIAEFGDLSSSVLGTPVLAVGKPNGNLYSVCTGMITEASVYMPIQDQGLRLYTMNLPYQKGRSGFVLNVRGQLLGMITTKYVDTTGEIDTAFFGLSDLITDINMMMQGKQMPYLGIHGIDVEQELADALGCAAGIYVEEVASESPAYQGEIGVTDVISEIDGHKMQTMNELHQYLAECRSGQEITVTVHRNSNGDGVKKKITLK